MPVAPKSFIPQLLNEIFQRHEKDITANKSPALIASLCVDLYAILGDIVQQALRLLDDEIITLYRRENCIAEIAEFTPNRGGGISAKSVKLLTGANFCWCPHFSHAVLQMNETATSNRNISYTCEHILALRLGILFESPCLRYVRLTENKFAYLGLQVYDQDF